MAPDEPIPGQVLAEVAYGNPATVDPADLVTLLDRAAPEDRRAGAEALARMASTAPQRIEQFASDLEEYLADEDADVRAHLLCTLASVAQVTPSAVTVTSRVLDGLVDDDPRVCEWAALTVAYVGGTPAGEREVAIDRLTALLESDRATVRRNACLGLAQLDASATDAIRPLLEDPDETVRETAEQVLTLLG